MKLSAKGGQARSDAANAMGEPHSSLLQLTASISEAVDIKTNQSAGASHIYYYGTTLNYGSQSGLQISKNYVPYIKFDLNIIGDGNVFKRWIKTKKHSRSVSVPPRSYWWW
jgi:hypothetical protein